MTDRQVLVLTCAGAIECDIALERGLARLRLEQRRALLLPDPQLVDQILGDQRAARLVARPPVPAHAGGRACHACCVAP